MDAKFTSGDHRARVIQICMKTHDGKEQQRAF